MKGMLETIATMPSNDAIFFRGEDAISAGTLRATAMRAAELTATGSGPLFVHTHSAAMFTAALLVAHQNRRPLALLPHMQPAYLEQIGADPKQFLSDDGPGALLRIEQADKPTAPFEVESAADLPLVFFTSGSSEAPKQVSKQLSQLETEASIWIERFEGTHDRIAGTVSHQHIYGCIFRVVLPVLAGLRSEDAQSFTWEAFIHTLGTTGLGVTSPAHLTRLPPDIQQDHAHSRVFLSSGQLLPFPAAKQIADMYGAPPIEILGSTETGGVATRQCSQPDEPWKPLSNVEIELDEAGTLLVRSSQAGGADFVSMGDRAERLDDGRFNLLSRVDGVMKVGGKRVSQSRVEAVLSSHDEVETARVLLLKDAENSDDRLGAVVVLSEEGRAALGRLGNFRYSREILKTFSDTLDAAERPKRWRFVSTLPRTAQGKTTAAALKSMFQAISMQKLLIPDRIDTDETASEIEFEVRPDLPWFEGHFPDRPVLPGVSQVHIAVQLAEELWAFAPASHDVTRLKFHRIILPGDRVHLTLSRDPERQQLGFKYKVGNRVASEGTIGRRAAG